MRKNLSARRTRQEKRELPMDADQRNARIFGVLFIITFITAIPALALFQPVLDDPPPTLPVAAKTARSISECS